MAIKSNTLEFVEKARKVHGDLYDYSSVDYKLTGIKVSIICKQHGAFQQHPHNHLTGAGCKKCTLQKSPEYKRNCADKFIKEAQQIYGDLFDYSQTIYTHSQSKISVICKQHGAFEQSPVNHLAGRGCRQCTEDKQLKSRKQRFLDEAKHTHGDFYNYEFVNYKNNRIPVNIVCPDHGDFEQAPDNHINGANCPTCSLENRNRKNLKNFWKMR
jgi:hypothetical protein